MSDNRHQRDVAADTVEALLNHVMLDERVIASLSTGKDLGLAWRVRVILRAMEREHERRQWRGWKLWPAEQLGRSV